MKFESSNGRNESAPQLNENEAIWYVHLRFEHWESGMSSNRTGEVRLQHRRAKVHLVLEEFGDYGSKDFGVGLDIALEE